MGKLTLAEQQKLPWCNCDFRATGTWKWCCNYDWCEGRARTQNTPDSQRGGA